MNSVEQYPQDGYYLVANGSSLEIGSYIIGDGDLKTAHIRVYNKNASTFSYGLKLQISSREGGPVLAESEVITYADTDYSATHQLVDFTFNFTESYDLIAGETYFVRLAITGYTRDDDNIYLGVWCDWLEPIGTANTGGARIAFGVYK